MASSAHNPFLLWIAVGNKTFCDLCNSKQFRKQLQKKKEKEGELQHELHGGAEGEEGNYTTGIEGNVDGTSWTYHFPCTARIVVYFLEP